MLKCVFTTEIINNGVFVIATNPASESHVHTEVTKDVGKIRLLTHTHTHIWYICEGLVIEISRFKFILLYI